MRKWTVLFKMDGKTVFCWQVLASGPEQAVDECMFVPYFYDIEYDEMEVVG